MQHPIFSFNNIIHSSNGNKYLSIKKFEIHRGAIYLIDGSMGSGKTTFIDMLSRNITVNEGTCNYETKSIYSYKNRIYKDQVALVPQVFKIPYGTVASYILKTLKKYSHISDKKKKMDEIVRKMNLESLLSIKMKHLSPGQLRWVVLAANIAADTKVLLIDEIEQHLNPNYLNKLVKLLYRKSNYDGVTIIATTQNKDMIFQRLISVTVTLDAGRIKSVRSTNKKRKKYSKKAKK